MDRYNEEKYILMDAYVGDMDSLVGLIDRVTPYGDVDLVRDVYQHALNQGWPMDVFSLYYIESYLRAEHYEEARVFLQDLFAQKPAWMEQQKGHFRLLQAVDEYALGRQDLGQAHLRDAIGDEAVLPKIMDHAAKMLSGMDSLEAKEAAYELWKEAIRRDPRNERHWRGVIEIQVQGIKDEALADNVLAILQLRHPSTKLLAKAYAYLSSDRFLWDPSLQSALSSLEQLLEKRGVLERIRAEQSGI
jgi:tetratricopeptide (TPR) repeat protein